jgi:hypothetical protein
MTEYSTLRINIPRKRGDRRPMLGVKRLLEKMKKELSMLRRNVQCGEEIAHADPEMFVLVIDRRGLVRFVR